MSLLNKVKNFFYEEVEVDEAEEARKEEEKRRLKEQKREERKRAAMEKMEKARIEKQQREEMEQERRIEVPEELPVVKKEENLSERELFKSERTFNFPMDLGDDIFDEGEKVMEEERPKEEPKKTYTRPVIPSRYENISTTSREPVKEVVDEGPHRFKPSPVISPVYGILDKNYTVDDVKEKNLSKTKEFSLEKKIVDFDSVRNKAYKELDEEIEKTLTGSKDIFYNLDEEEPVIENNIEDTVEDEYKEEEHNAEEDVIITFEDEEPTETNIEIEEPEITVEVEKTEPEVEEQPEEDEEDVFTPDVAIVKETRTSRRAKKSKKAAKEEKETEEKEDLFNLIDNMYNDEDEEDDD
ncbi:MAG: hypothetical protein IKF36_04910 [Bacilli bacterium]|nr:hypothetical protein [Bacilli bacterium]